MGKRLTDDQKRQIIMLSKNGYSYNEIAGKVDCSAGAVYTTIKKAKDCHWHELELSLYDSAADEHADQSEEEDDYMNDWKKIYDRIRELTTRRDEIEDELWNLRATLLNAVDMINGKDKK